jgi:hypothetical protein
MSTSNLVCETCNSRSTLGKICKICHKYHCNKHILPELHNCSKLDEFLILRKQEFSQKLKNASEAYRLKRKEISEKSELTCRAELIMQKQERDIIDLYNRKFLIKYLNRLNDHICKNLKPQCNKNDLISEKSHILKNLDDTNILFSSILFEYYVLLNKVILKTRMTSEFYEFCKNSLTTFKPEDYSEIKEVFGKVKKKYDKFEEKFEKS